MRSKTILLIGIGGMGIKHLKAILNLKKYNVVCFDIDKEKLKSIGNDYASNKVITIKNLQRIKHYKIICAFISTPINSHLKYAKICLSKNIPFLVEKPLAMEKKGWEIIIKESKRKNLPSAVGYPRRHSLAINKIKRMVEKGKIGKLKLLKSSFSQDFRKYRPDYFRTYFAKRSSGGGIIRDALSHHIDLMIYFAGGVDSISSVYEKMVFSKVNVEDTALIHLKFKNGILGSIIGNQWQKPNEDFIELIGTGGNLKYERNSDEIYFNNSDKKNWKKIIVKDTWDKILERQSKNFIESIEKQCTSGTPLIEAMHNIEIVNTIYNSNNFIKVK